MFGINVSNNWAVKCVKNSVSYYLSQVDDTFTNIVWTKKRDKSKKYTTSNDALKCAEQIKQNHNKKLEINIAQV